VDLLRRLVDEAADGVGDLEGDRGERHEERDRGDQARVDAPAACVDGCLPEMDAGGPQRTVVLATTG
jgi:hypothetical protein